MFTLHLDAILYFDPPMAEDGRGICVSQPDEMQLSLTLESAPPL